MTDSLTAVPQGGALGGSRRPAVGFVWHGLPMYAARLLRAAIETDVACVTVVASRPPFAVDGIEAVVPVPIHWASDRRTSWERLGLDVPDIVISSGWAFPLCNSLAREAVRHGRTTVMMSDNRWRGDLRQIVGRGIFRLFHRRWVTAGWVPGESAASLLQHMGMPSRRIYRRLYGCDPGLFRSSIPLADRSKTIVFVGQMILRKGVDVLIEGFEQSQLARHGWTLVIFGSGRHSGLAQGRTGVIHHEFSPPTTVSDAVKAARIFALPSRDDNWPLALHEGATAGCQLLATTAVGSHAELISPDNGAVVKPGSSAEIATALIDLAAASGGHLQAAETTSVRLASAYGPLAFGEEFCHICRDLG